MFRPTDVVAVVVATLMFLNGMFGSFEEPINGTMQIAFALFMVGFILLMRLQAQMKALGLLVRQLEQKRQTGEKCARPHQIRANLLAWERDIGHHRPRSTFWPAFYLPPRLSERAI